MAHTVHQTLLVRHYVHVSGCCVTTCCIIPEGLTLACWLHQLPANKLTNFFFAGFTFLWLYGRGLYKVGAQPALLAGITHPWQWIWHLQLTLHTQLCLSDNAFMPVDVMSSCTALYQGGQPWPAGCTSLSQQTNYRFFTGSTFLWPYSGEL